MATLLLFLISLFSHLPLFSAGFYAENLLLYNKLTQHSGKLPLPIGPNHKFAPVALGDVAQIAAHVLTGQGPHGLSDKHRGQLIVVTGPMYAEFVISLSNLTKIDSPRLTGGNELATAAHDALGVKLEFQDISE